MLWIPLISIIYNGIISEIIGYWKSFKIHSKIFILLYSSSTKILFLSLLSIPNLQFIRKERKHQTLKNVKIGAGEPNFSFNIGNTKPIKLPATQFIIVDAFITCSVEIYEIYTKIPQPSVIPKNNMKIQQPTKITIFPPSWTSFKEFSCT